MTTPLGRGHCHLYEIITYLFSFTLIKATTPRVLKDKMSIRLHTMIPLIPSVLGTTVDVVVVVVVLLLPDELLSVEVLVLLDVLPPVAAPSL